MANSGNFEQNVTLVGVCVVFMTSHSKSHNIMSRNKHVLKSKNAASYYIIIILHAHYYKTQCVNVWISLITWPTITKLKEKTNFVFKIYFGISYCAHYSILNQIRSDFNLKSISFVAMHCCYFIRYSSNI